MNDRRNTLPQTHPKLTGFGEKTQQMTAEWKEMSEKDRTKWDKAAAAAKVKYAATLAEY